ncbi:MAG: Ig-like domain-containing protein [Bacteroidota bacterium]
MRTINLLRGFLFLSIQVLFTTPSFSQLKSIVYDFDGLHIDQTNLPDFDYKVNDLTYKIATNPIASKEVLGDRVLKMNLNWNSGNGSFGRKIERYIELNPSSDILNFYFYNPLSNNQNATIEVLISEDDDQSNTYDFNKDDLWLKKLTLPNSSGWQFISIPLSDFSDSNAGGNGIFDATFSGNKGMLLKVEFKFNKNNTSLSNPTFFIDLICFSDGILPTGATVFDLPSKNESDHCLLGAYNSSRTDLIPDAIENLFPASPEKKLKYVNWFLQFATDGTTTAKKLPGDEVTILLNKGYRPIITWEPMFQKYSRLDPVQPRLDDIINGDYNSYIDAFADKLKSYNDTIIIRFMHEFDGDWYSWSLVENGHDPNKYIAAFRKVVDRVRARGATKVQWMWCTNGDYFPRRSYNWMVPAYPGDNYVDIVATDIYNNHTPTELPDWKSFKLKAIETYYYLSKYFPQKPLFICELGCRERYSNENTSSETKAAWLARMDKELQSNFRKVRALVFFSSFVVYDWRVNSSSATINSIASNIWNDDYYFKPSATTLNVSITSPANNSTFSAGSTIVIQATASGGPGTIQKVEFFEGSTKLGEDLTQPYSYTWNNVSIGSYTLRAKVTDDAGNTFTSAPVNINVDMGSNSPCAPTGTITRDKWNNFQGKTIAAIPVNTTPSSSILLNLFEGPQNNGDNYASRIRGYICPPSTGNYIFWIASDNNSELYLSSNNDPNNKVKIAQQDLSTSSRQWTKYANQKSQLILLTAGQSYYIEALHREGSQSDNLAVGWQLPNGTQERPIPGNRLSPFQTGSTLALKPNAQPIPQIIITGPVQINKEEKTILSTEFDTSAIFQWKINGSIIPAANKNFMNVTKPGSYQVKVIKNGMISLSDTVDIWGDQKTDMINLPTNSDAKDIIEGSDILKVYPNPNTGLFTIVVCMPASELTKIQILMMNNLGQVVYKKKLMTENNCINETLEIDRSIPSGVYTLKVIIGNKVENTNVVLLR